MTLKVYLNGKLSLIEKDVLEVNISDDNELWIHYDGFEGDYKICDLDERIRFEVEK